MKEGRSLMQELERVAEEDGRYDAEGYYFIFRALDHTLQNLGRGNYAKEADPDDVESRHVSGQELLVGIRELALEDFGALAKVVFNHWGIRRTEDFGNMVFNLVENNLMGKTDRDSMEDFIDGYDFEEVFEKKAPINTEIDAEA